jgi:chemotaxis family two-component system response regulator Rcp1
LDYSHAFTTPTAMPAPVSAWPSVSASLIATMGGSGSNRNPDADRSSASLSRSDQSGVRPWQILIAEDSKSDVYLIRQALKKSGIDAQIHVADDGEKAVMFFEQADADAAAPCPDLILLDINMPRYKGGDILRKLRASARCKDALVLIVTSSDSQRDREDMEAFGANGYFRKPSEFSEFMKLGPLVCDLLARNQPPPQ